ncbi:MAG: helix-turn-helix domain-containing protein [Corticimicrobacter sp.]|uniref:helix-turn-helix domain-containing protein n=1 Tax=Corticimicrobacter sp. TaxID=2678536 RepID=UPI0032DB1F95
MSALSLSSPVVAVLAFDRISPFHLSVPCLVFGDELQGASRYDVRVCAAEPGLLRTSAGFDIVARYGLAMLEEADIIVVPSWRDPAERPPQRLLDALVAANRRGALLVGLCLGAYVLAEAGLLGGRRATTHWAFAADFSTRYPDVRLDPDVLYIEEENLMTSAGTAAGLDCCLHIVRQHHGSGLANWVARRMVVSPLRQGGQAQFIEQPLPATGQGLRLSDLLDWVRGHLEQVHTLDSLAQRACVSRRTLSRQIRQLTGMTVGQWLLRERLSRAQQLLEGTNMPVEKVAEAAGFGSTASMRLYFSRMCGLTPGAWRMMYRG